ncbi:hypothetical protein [Actinomadura chokoriensis]|uniref:Uncharacterized protein n=1 Tax=Actinomadura chokoriensis TaxID=454156 RepID=A0ABV4R6N8_9ACTN
MAPQTPARRTRPRWTRRARGPSPSLTARHGIAFALNPCASLLRLYAEAGPVAVVGTRRRPFVHLVCPGVTPTSVTAMRPRGGLPVGVLRPGG